MDMRGLGSFAALCCALAHATVPPWTPQKPDGALLLVDARRPADELTLASDIELSGDTRTLFYLTPASTAPLALVALYEAHLLEAGFEVVRRDNAIGRIRRRCSALGDACGRFEGSRLDFALDGGRSRVFKRDGDAGEEYVALYVNRVRAAARWSRGASADARLDAATFEIGRSVVMLVVVSPRATTTTLVDESAAWMARSLDETGRVELRGILFAVDRADIDPASETVLAQVADLLRRRPALALRVRGHTDGSGGAAHNLALSQRRADAVVAALVSRHGIEPSRLAAEGVGMAEPVADNDTPQGRMRNRRVELVPADPRR